MRAIPVPANCRLARQAPVALGGSAGARKRQVAASPTLINRTLDNLNMKSEGTRVVVQGFGNVGSITAQQLHRFGAKIIGVSDFAVASTTHGGWT